MEVLITSHVKVSLANKYNSYIHTARNAKVTSNRIVYEKTVMKRSVFRGVFRTHSNIYDEAFFEKIAIGVTLIHSHRSLLGSKYASGCNH